MGRNRVLRAGKEAGPCQPVGPPWGGVWLVSVRCQGAAKLLMFTIPPGKEPWAAGDGAGDGAGEGSS